MKFVNFVFPLVLLLLTANKAAQAQEVIASSGNYGVSVNSRIVWTIGEIITETASGSNVMLTQGFNQGDLILTYIKTPELPGLFIKAYPNPASDILKISVSNKDIKDLEYVMYNMTGQVVRKNVLNDGETTVSLENLSPSVYLLKIYHNKTESAIIKIIKHK